jgi:hypothetical protein
MDWKNKLERTIGMNTAIVKAEQNNFLYKKIIEDLERKNKTLHACTYTAHQMLVELAALAAKTETPVTAAQIDSIRIRMEEIIEDGNRDQPKVEDTRHGSVIVEG